MDSGKKTIHFVRHCQSTWNEAQHIRKLTHKDKELQSEAYIDAPLTTFGQEQAAKVKRKIQDLQAEVAISSPLKRAIETCIRTHGDRNVVVTHWCAERGESICDIGTTKIELEKIYPMIDFSNLPPDVWWYVDEKFKHEQTDPRKCFEWVLSNGTFKLGETDNHFEQRLERFHDFLQNRSESNIVVFSHSMFLRHFLFKYYGRPLLQVIPNGELVTYTL